MISVEAIRGITCFTQSLAHPFISYKGKFQGWICQNLPGRSHFNFQKFPITYIFCSLRSQWAMGNMFSTLKHTFYIS